MWAAENDVVVIVVADMLRRSKVGVHVLLRVPSVRACAVRVIDSFWSKMACPLQVLDSVFPSLFHTRSISRIFRDLVM